MKVKIVSDLGETLVTEELKTCVFKSGSRGHRASFKVGENGTRYQVGIQAVEIGSKPATAPAPAPA